MKRSLVLCGLFMCLLACALPAQIFNQPKSLNFNYAVRMSIALGKNRASFYNASASVSIQNTWSEGDFRLVPGTQITLNYYSKGLGTSIVDGENRSGQLDLVTSFFATGGMYDARRVNSLKYIRPFNQFSATSIYHDMDYALTYGTSFIVNNHGRNQQVGNLNFNIDQIMLGYYNDGFWPFNRFASDLYDRFWTGGGYFSIGMNVYGIAGEREWFDQQFLEYAYDRFTGNVQNGYKLSKELLLFAVPQRNTKDIFLNRALTSISLRNRSGSSMGIGVYGQCPKCDIQDFLHRKLGFSRHLSFAAPTLIILGGYQYNQFSSINK
jgi:hypothetical protein